MTVFLLSRILVWGSLQLGYACVAVRHDLLNPLSGVGPSMLGSFVRYDGVYYLDVALNGYRYGSDVRSSVAFFPLYPILINLATRLVGDPVVAGLLISHAAFLAALVLLYRLAQEEIGEEPARRCIVYLALFPTSMFLSVLYPESLFLLCAVAALRAATRQSWGLAALFGLLAGVARPAGVAVWVAVGVQWLLVHRAWGEAGDSGPARPGQVRAFVQQRWSLAWLLAMPLGILAYMSYLDATYGQPMAFCRIQTHWGRVLEGPLTTLILACNHQVMQPLVTGRFEMLGLLDLVSAIAGLVVSACAWKRLGPSYGAFCLASILVPLSSGTMSMTRYLSVTFPLFMVLGLWGRHRLADRLLVTAFSTLLAILSVMFAGWYFVG